ncbi:MAG TPA: cation diffusion facilitator family transporter [Dehalococcoidia bacterium]|nr:cation diffusion facilitator family transporter [Dehalococcoidia bacterium]
METTHLHEHRQGSAQKLSAALLSIFINLSLITVEGIIAYLTGSLAVFADAAHSFFDLGASLFAFWGVRMAARPPDRSYPYGYDKFENISSLVQVIMIALIAVVIVGQVTFNLVNGYDLEVTNAAIIVIGITVGVDFLAARYIGSVAEAHHSYALEADAFHFTTDLWTKLAALAGLLAARLGSEWVDPVAALSVAGVMVYTASRLGLRSTRVLLDTAPRSHLEEQVRAILEEEAGEQGYHSLRMRQSGKWVFLDVVLHMPNRLTLSEAHEKAHRVAGRLQSEIAEVRDAVVHVEPEDHPDGHDNDHYQDGLAE